VVGGGGGEENEMIDTDGLKIMRKVGFFIEKLNMFAVDFKVMHPWDTYKKYLNAFPHLLTEMCRYLLTFIVLFVASCNLQLYVLCISLS
jgi:hypothetical protein